MFWTMTAFIVFLLLLGLTWRGQPKLAFGIVIGLLVGAIAAGWIGPYESLSDVPLWLPPLPFAVVAVGLLIYGALAWWGLDSDADED